MEKNQGNMDRKTLTDYFVESKKKEGEEFKKNNPNFVESFDALNHTATAMSIAPDFMFNPERFNDKKSIDDLNRRIYDNMEIVGSSFSNDPLINSPSLYNYLGYIENEVESSSASNKLKVASGVGLLKLKEIVNDIKKGELEDVPDSLKKKDVSDLLDAQILGMKDFMKEIGINRPNDEKLYPRVENKTIKSIFSKESKTSEKETIKEEKTNTKSEVSKVNEVSPLPTPTPEIVPVTNPIKTEAPTTVSTPVDRKKAEEEMEDRLISSKSGAKIVSDKPTPVSNTSNTNNVTNLNKSELANTVNENRPTTTENKSVSNTSVVSNVTNTSPVVENNPVIKSEQPTGLVKETTSSTGVDLRREMESLFEGGDEGGGANRFEDSVLNSMWTQEEPAKTSSVASSKISDSIKDESPKSVVRSETQTAPKEIATVKKMEGPKISPVTKVLETKKEEIGEKEKTTASPLQSDIEETSALEGVSSESTPAKTQQSGNNETSNKDLQESLSRMESLMAELVRIMKGPILTIDGKVNYS